ncbi:MAG: glutathione S-transferase [Hyphomicrobiaceae bacterium]|nr:glutathione S-transferase [Hyphomicrobiaceae bacterium]
MKLYLNTASPYARLCRVLVMETGLAAGTELINTDPWTQSDEFWRINPAGKIPALVLQDGTTLIESTCIADYLIATSRRTDLDVCSSKIAARRLEVLGLARAAMDCAFGTVIQHRFNKDPALADRWLQALSRIIARLDDLHESELRISSPDNRVLEPARCDLADLTVAVALGYVDFRLPDVGWRENAPRLAEWIEILSERSSLAATRLS